MVWDVPSINKLLCSNMPPCLGCVHYWMHQISGKAPQIPMTPGASFNAGDDGKKTASGFPTLLHSPLLRVWDSLVGRLYISSCDGPLTPLLDNCSFPVCVGRKTLFLWVSHAPSPISGALTPQGLKPLSNLPTTSRPEMVPLFSVTGFLHNLENNRVVGTRQAHRL